MVLPNLLHPVKIVISQWVAGTTIYDEDTREPIKQAARLATETIIGQVSWEIKDDVVIYEGGTRLDAIGYVLFRWVDLNSKGVTLKRQDEIRKIGWQDTKLYIVGTKPAGHYTDQGGSTLVRAYFSDRAPSRNA
jgi:hypothetical protein